MVDGENFPEMRRPATWMCLVTWKELKRKHNTTAVVTTVRF